MHGPARRTRAASAGVVLAVSLSAVQLPAQIPRETFDDGGATSSAASNDLADRPSRRFKSLAERLREFRRKRAAGVSVMTEDSRSKLEGRGSGSEDRGPGIEDREPRSGDPWIGADDPPAVFDDDRGYDPIRPAHGFDHSAGHAALTDAADVPHLDYEATSETRTDLRIHAYQDGADFPDASVPEATFHQSPQTRPLPDTIEPDEPLDEYRFLPQPPAVDETEDPSWWSRLSPRRYGPQWQVGFAATWLPGGGDRLGMFDYNIDGTLAFTALPGFSVRPGFQTHFLDGPARTDLPPRWHNARVEFRQLVPVTQQLALELALAPGYWGDFERSDSETFRITGRALGYYTASVRTRWVLGLMYLDREDVTLLPAFGVIHSPEENLRLELLFPRPRLAMRLTRLEAAERWVYLAGEFGGGSWFVVRRNGAGDVATYSDWRLVLGLEQKFVNGRSLLVEAGYVFNRELDYSRGPGDFDPDDTVMLRAGIVY